MNDTSNVQSSYRTFSTSYDDPEEAALEAKEAPKYLLAKAFFDTKEFDRCAAVFLPPAIPAGGLAIFDKPKGRTPTSTPLRAKGKSKQNDAAGVNPYPRLSQKSLFLSLYARYLAGEKRKDEETEMVLGPADGGQTINPRTSFPGKRTGSIFQCPRYDRTTTETLAWMARIPLRDCSVKVKTRTASTAMAPPVGTTQSLPLGSMGRVGLSTFLHR